MLFPLIPNWKIPGKGSDRSHTQGNGKHYNIEVNCFCVTSVTWYFRREKGDSGSPKDYMVRGKGDAGVFDSMCSLEFPSLVRISSCILLADISLIPQVHPSHPFLFPSTYWSAQDPFTCLPAIPQWGSIWGKEWTSVELLQCTLYTLSPLVFMTNAWNDSDDPSFRQRKLIYL